MLQRIAQLSWERRAPSGWPARAARRRAGTSSTTSSAQLSLGGLSACRLRAAHFLRPNKAGEASLNLGRLPGWGFPADLTSTGEAAATLHPKPRPEPVPGLTTPPNTRRGTSVTNRPRGLFLAHTKVRRRQ